MPTRICPECGEDLTRWSIRSHSLTHWPANLDAKQASEQALERHFQLSQWADEQERSEAANLQPMTDRQRAGLPERPAPAAETPPPAATAPGGGA